MWWRFSLLIGALVASSFVYALNPGLPRTMRLAFPDGAPVSGVEVRWLDEQDRLCVAAETRAGIWQIPADTVALEVRGEAVADSLLSIGAGQAAATLSRPARLEVRIEGYVPSGAPPLMLHVLGSLNGMNQRARQDQELRAFWALDSPDRLLAHTAGGLRYRFRGGPGPVTPAPPSVPRPTHGGLRWSDNGTELTWMPALADQLTAEALPDGVFRFDELPVGAEVVVLVDPSSGVALRKPSRDERQGRVHGVSAALQLTSDPEVTLGLAVQAASEIVLEQPPTMDQRSMIVLERRFDAWSPGTYPWEKVGRLDSSDLIGSSPGFNFQRLEAGVYRLSFEQHAQGEWHSWVGEESWNLGPGETLRVPLASQQLPQDHVPLEVRVRAATAGSSPVLRLDPALELGENLCFEVDLEDGRGQWVPWMAWRCRVQADGRLSPQPWIPEHTQVRLRITEDYRGRFESHGRWLMQASDLDQTLNSGSNHPLAWTLNVTPAP